MSGGTHSNAHERTRFPPVSNAAAIIHALANGRRRRRRDRERERGKRKKKTSKSVFVRRRRRLRGKRSLYVYAMNISRDPFVPSPKCATETREKCNFANSATADVGTLRLRRNQLAAAAHMPTSMPAYSTRMEFIVKACALVSKKPTCIIVRLCDAPTPTPTVDCFANTEVTPAIGWLDLEIRCNCFYKF